MKRGTTLFILIISLIMPLVLAADVNISNANNTNDEDSKINKAYSCLEDKVVDNCDDLSLEEKIFSLLSLGECKDELISEAEGDKECWPSGNCDVKLTAIALLALDEAGTSASDAEDWLLSQYTVPSNVNWFLEIENPNGETSCTITYSNSSYAGISIQEDKKISPGSQGLGSCLSLESNAYWLNIAPSCYDKEFKISCSEGFLTTLLFKKDDSSTIHVSEDAHTASAEGATTETVNSLCFSEGSSCNYEGSLWATFVLDYLDHDVSAYIPYLVTTAEDNERYLPESFLFRLTGYSDFKNDLLLKQKSKYWDESGDKFYDTALAMYSLYENSQEEENTKDWLLEIQEENGCWNSGNIRNTAFILYSVWPKSSGGDGGDEELEDCEDSGYYCMSNVDCEGTILSGYGCSSALKCCSVEKLIDTCSEQGGDICNSAQSCVGGVRQEASGLESGQECCVGGSCQNPPEETECEFNSGTCRSNSCFDDEEPSGDDCGAGDVCCVEKVIPPTKSYWWIWLLLILIILLVIAIIFRDKLRPYWFKLKSKFKKSKPGYGMPGFPTTPSGMRPVGPSMQRRILPPTSQRPPIRRPPLGRPRGDIDEVLKKLKDMGK